MKNKCMDTPLYSPLYIYIPSMISLVPQKDIIHLPKNNLLSNLIFGSNAKYLLDLWDKTTN